MRLTKSLMKLEDLIDDVFKQHDTIKDNIEVEAKANVYEPFEEYVKHIEVKTLKLTKR